MVTETRPVLDQGQVQVKTGLGPKPVLDVGEVGKRIGLPIVIRPWWGSARQHGRRFHIKCGGDIAWRNYCTKCYCSIPLNEIDTEKAIHKWICPGDYSYSSVKWPEVRHGVVVMWEGPCRLKPAYQQSPHTHQQSLQVVNMGETAFLLKISVSCNWSQFLIGMDDGHPFVTPVLRKLPTVQDAFDWLVPKKVREALILGKDVKRQGDWFFIPTIKEPRIDPFCRDPLGGRTRQLYQWERLIYGFQTRHIGEMVVYQYALGLPYPAPFVKGDVIAPDHPTLHLEGWHIAIRTRSTTGGRSGPGLD